MTENERELLKLIREHENPEKALLIAFEIMSHFLKSNGTEPRMTCTERGV